MKIGIVTFLDNKNYGNRWQNYAMIKLLSSVGIEVETLYFWKRNAPRKNMREVIKRILPFSLAYSMHVISSYQIKSVAMLKRVIKFKTFTDKHIKYRMVLIKEYEEINKKIHSKEYDFFAVGSDQVWNPYYAASPIYFLEFAEKEKRLAFMASFGSDVIPENQIDQFCKWISEMSYISVREPSGKDIIKNLTGREADVFLDPTLLLEYDNWIQICKKPKNIRLPIHYAVSFMFNYDLEEIKEECRTHNIELLNLNSLENKKMFSLDPQEMLYLLRNAEMVFTDSFHIMALAIRLNRQFYVFRRIGFEDMFSRLESTLDRLNIKECIFENKNSFDWNPISESKYADINHKLNEEKNKFLKRVLEITDKKEKYGEV